MRLPNIYARLAHGNVSMWLAGIWMLYLLISPLYVFPKGLPQPADLLLMMGITGGLIVSFLSYRGGIPMVYLVGMLFVGLTFIINLTNNFFFPDKRLLLSSTYYAYNFLVFAFVVHLFSKDHHVMKDLTYFAVASSVIVQCLWAILFPDFGVKRMTAAFHNPNQLSYWGLCMAAMIFYLKRDETFSRFDFFLFVVIAYIQALALSKSGIISYSVMLIFLIFARQTPARAKIGLGVGLVFFGIFIGFLGTQVFSFYDDVAVVERVVGRIAGIGQENDDSLEGRGYNRIWENPHYLVYGAGEGSFDRFRTRWSSNELHSGLATIVFSYGVFGFALFGLFVMLVVYKQPWQCWAIMFAVILYGASSQTIRFTHTWATFGIAYATFVYSPARLRGKGQAHLYAPPDRPPISGRL